jgi:DNA-binding beta-propeller fold protein YncE
MIKLIKFMESKHLFFFIFGLLLNGCFVTATVNPDKFYEKEYNLYWPAPPNKPKIGLVKVINSPFDNRVVIEETKTSKLIKWLIGEENLPISSFQRPYSIFVKNGKIFVVEQGLFSVVVMDIMKGKTSFLQTTTEGDILYYPTSVTVDDEGNIYVCDPEKERIVVYKENGKPFKIFGKEYSPWRPCGIAYNKRNGRFYVVDSINHSVKIFDKQFKLVSSVGKLGEENGNFNYPTHIFIDKDGNFYVTDSMNFRVQYFSEDGKFLGKVGRMGKGDGYLERPKGVCVDNMGHIYIVDSLQGIVQIFDKKDRFLMAFGDDGSYPGQFNLPSGIYCDEKNYIYVADTLNKRIQILKYVGSID